MKKFYLYLLAVMVICLPFSAWAAAPNVVPSLQEWTDDSGTFSLAVNSRICVDSAYSAQLTDTANVLKEDLLALNGRTLTVINTTSPAAGDFYLTLNCSIRGWERRIFTGDWQLSHHQGQNGGRGFLRYPDRLTDPETGCGEDQCSQGNGPGLSEIPETGLDDRCGAEILSNRVSGGLRQTPGLVKNE